MPMITQSSVSDRVMTVEDIPELNDDQEGGDGSEDFGDFNEWQDGTENSVADN